MDKLLLIKYADLMIDDIHDLIYKIYLQIEVYQLDHNYIRYLHSIIDQTSSSMIRAYKIQYIKRPEILIEEDCSVSRCRRCISNLLNLETKAIIICTITDLTKDGNIVFIHHLMHRYHTSCYNETIDYLLTMI
jgi:hypothetical protein